MASQPTLEQLLALLQPQAAPSATPTAAQIRAMAAGQSEDFGRFSDAQIDAWAPSYDAAASAAAGRPQYRSEGGGGALVDKPTECPPGTTLHGRTCVPFNPGAAPVAAQPQQQFAGPILQPNPLEQVMSGLQTTPAATVPSQMQTQSVSAMPSTLENLLMPVQRPQAAQGGAQTGLAGVLSGGSVSAPQRLPAASQYQGGLTNMMQPFQKAQKAQRWF